MAPFIKRPLSKRLRQALQDFCDAIVDALEAKGKPSVTISFEKKQIEEKSYSFTDLSNAFDFLIKNQILDKKSNKQLLSQISEGIYENVSLEAATIFSFKLYVNETNLDKLLMEFNTGDSVSPKEKVPYSEPDKKDGDKIIYEIQYDNKVREIKLLKWGQFRKILRKPDFNSENDNVFRHLFDHANRTVTLNELSDNCGGLIKKSIHSIVTDLKFTGDLGKIFFTKSKTEIIFHNPVYLSRIESLGLTYHP